MDSQTSWTPPRIGKLLGLTDDQAKELLLAMGYIESVTHTWFKGSTPDAKARREKWVSAEAESSMYLPLRRRLAYNWRQVKDRARRFR